MSRNQSLMLAMRIVLFLPMPKLAHEFLTLFHRPCGSYLQLSDSTAPIRFIVKFLSQITLCFSFGSKDKIRAFTCLPPNRYSSITLRAYLCWSLEAHLLPVANIIELGKNVSPKNKMAASHVAQIHMHVRFPRSKKWPTYHVVAPTGMLQLHNEAFSEKIA